MLARRRNRLTLRIAVGAAAVAALAVGLTAGGRAARRPAPALPSHVLSGTAMTLADLRGHPAAVVFWASWCTDCRVEANAVETVAHSAAGRGRLVGIDYDDGGGWHDFLRKHGWSFPILDDAAGNTGAAFGIANLPATVILDSGGRIASIRYGAQTVPGLTSALSAAG